MRMFLVQHVREDDDGDEDVKVIGVYSSEEAATAAVDSLAEQPGFRDAPDGFHTTPYEVDKTQWEEGFEVVPDE